MKKIKHRNEGARILIMPYVCVLQYPIAGFQMGLGTYVGMFTEDGDYFSKYNYFFLN